MINQDWIDRWADLYPEKHDEELLNQVGPRVRERGHYDLQDFIAVGKWKSPRATSKTRGMASNPDEMIHDVTSMALAAPLPIQHKILTLLKGVNVPMASALLMAWRPDEHTVIDKRAVKSLVMHGEIPALPSKKDYPPYLEYLAVCNAISQRCDRSLRIVDRALYKAKGRK